jgi:DNA excision repair protein ERCC-3
MSMMSSAYTIHNRIGGKLPPRGTGPLGGGSGNRWITANDVMAFHFFNEGASRQRFPVWNSNQDMSVQRSLVSTNVTLRGYQMQAVLTANPAPGVFKSGEIEIGCGLGKTFVGGELIRLSRAPAVVVTQHQLSVDQWVSHLKNNISFQNVITTQDPWSLRDPLPDVVVTTYQTVVRVATDMCEQKHCIDEGLVPKEESHRIIWALHCIRFGLLILDEVHMGVADQFRMASLLNASAVYGLSGSMIREDDRLNRMERLVGPKIYCYHSDRTMLYEVITTPISEQLQKLLTSCNKRSAFEQALRALNPAKICALDMLLRKHQTKKIIVFCDSRQAAIILQRHIASSHLLHGGVTDEARRTIVESFSCCDGGSVLISTRVCDAAIDFPSGCIIIQLFSSCGSRQQEVQRAGRGSRGDGLTGSNVYHFVNEGTEEVEFVERRVQHMKELFTVELKETTYSTNWEVATRNEPLEYLISQATTLKLPMQPTGGKRKR